MSDHLNAAVVKVAEAICYRPLGVGTAGGEVMNDELYKLVVDVKQRRPACVLLQAAFGGDSRALQFLSSDDWLISPTDDMRMVTGTAEQWKTFDAELARRRPQGGWPLSAVPQEPADSQPKKES